jgi:hypothetical protein
VGFERFTVVRGELGRLSDDDAVAVARGLAGLLGLAR